MSRYLRAIQSILVEHSKLPQEEVTPEATLQDDLGLDSIDMIAVIQELEDEFNVDIPDKDAGNLQTVQDIVEYLENYNS